MFFPPGWNSTFDLLRWLIPATIKFPRQHRFVLAEALQKAALRFQDELLEAAYSETPQPFLRQVDVTLVRLGLYLRLCHDLDLLSRGQYKHVARMVDEIGRLLGGWRKTEGRNLR